MIWDGRRDGEHRGAAQLIKSWFLYLFLQQAWEELISLAVMRSLQPCLTGCCICHASIMLHILPAFIVRSFPSPSLQRLPCSPSSYVRNEATKTVDFIKLQVPDLIFHSLPPLWCTPLFISLLMSSPPFWWLRWTYSNAVRVYPSPLRHTHAHTHTHHSSIIPWKCRSPGLLCPVAVPLWGIFWSQRQTQRTHLSTGPGSAGAEDLWSAEEHRWHSCFNLLGQLSWSFSAHLYLQD